MLKGMGQGDKHLTTEISLHYISNVQVGDLRLDFFWSTFHSEGLCSLWIQDGFSQQCLKCLMLYWLDLELLPRPYPSLARGAELLWLSSCKIASLRMG